MTSRMLASFLVLALAAPLGVSTASAQTVEEEMMEMEAQEGGDGSDGGGGVEGTGDPSGSGSGTAGGEGDHRIGDEQALYEEGQVVESAESGIDPREVHDENYYFLGLFMRGQVVPQFITSLFVEAGETPFNGGFGLFFNWRRNGFNVQIEAFYQGMQVDAYYRGGGDPDTEFEFIQSRLGIVGGSIGFGWGFDIADWFAIELGFGIGFAGVVGDLYRQEAYRDAVGGLHTCSGVGRGDMGETLDASNGYCEGPIETPGPDGRLDDTRTRGGTYQIAQGTPNPFYFGDGGIPPLFFTIDLPRISFRFKPIRQIQIRVDTAYNLYGFSFGLSAGYGF